MSTQHAARSTQHTPGPWELRNEFGMQGLIYPRLSDYPVAAVTGYYKSSGQMEPNARLIAVAPELLSALQAFNKFADMRRKELGELSPEMEVVADAARAAIANATGSATS